MKRTGLVLVMFALLASVCAARERHFPPSPEYQPPATSAGRAINRDSGSASAGPSARAGTAGSCAATSNRAAECPCSASSSRAARATTAGRSKA